MRPSWFVTSLLLHAAAIGAALGGSAFATRVERQPPRVELQDLSARSPAAPPLAPPVVVVREAPRVAVEPALTEVEIVEPFVPPEELPQVVTEVFERPELRAWSLLPVRRSKPVSDASAPVTIESTEPSRSDEPAARATPDVEAVPLADNPPPDYPEHDRLRGHEGTVRVLVFVDEHGAVLAAELAEPSAHAGLNRAALRAVRAWRFSPAQRDGAAAAGTTEVLVEFRLTGD